jgi:hypothetical protein
MKITENFNSEIDNMSCPCCGALVVNEDFIRRLQALRWIVGKPFVFDKAGGGFYRCRDYQMDNHPDYPDSQHLMGRAADVSTIGWSGKDKAVFLKNAFNLGLSIGRDNYDNWFHVDLRLGDQVYF